MLHLPKPYQRCVESSPLLPQSYEELALACHDAGPLEEKSRRLVKLGIAIGQKTEGVVKSHVRRALAVGASVEEVRHTVLLAMTTIGLPAMLIASEWIEEVIAAVQQ